MKKYQLDVGLVTGQIDRLPGQLKSCVKKKLGNWLLRRDLDMRANYTIAPIITEFGSMPIALSIAEKIIRSW